MKKIYFLLVIFCWGPLTMQYCYSQQTGNFDRTVNFGGNPTWTLSYNVPSGYTASKKYKLIIGLHGKGGNSQGYCKYTLAGLVADSTSPEFDAILVCPYAGNDPETDFWTPVSDTGIFTVAINDAMSVYNIDLSYIYINGFSLGGRSALRYGLINYWRFRGLQLWAPAIHGISEANNQTTFTYPYQNAKHIPITITTGTNDGLSFSQVASYRQLYDAGGKVAIDMIYNYPHGPSPYDYTLDCWNYIEKNASSFTSNDAAISAILAPLDAECSTIIYPKITIQNKGNKTLTSATINYQVDNGTVSSYNWSGTLTQLDEETITLPSQSPGTGFHQFKAYTSMPNGNTDDVPGNDSFTLSFNCFSQGATASMSEGFESHACFPSDWRHPTGWRQTGTDSAWYWALDTTLGGFGKSNACIHFDNAEPDNTGKKYSLITPVYNFSNSVNPLLTYDYAYAPIMNGTKILTDTLAIKYSTDCGNTWITLFEKGGVALNTSGTSTYGDKTIGEFFFPTSTQWGTETINLSPVIGNSNVILAFEDRAQNGNLLYLDNINLAGVTSVADQNEELNSFNIYPNPTNGLCVVNIHANEKCDFVLEVKNVLGQVVFNQNLNEFSGNYSQQLDLKQNGSGLYVISLKDQKTEIVKKLIIY